jgi:4Fe-4S ferredoxin
MPIKLLKTENKNKLVVEMVLHTKHYSLTLDKSKCIGCGICTEICPREAIEIKRMQKTDGKNIQHPTIRILKEKCNYCGICEAMCLFGALSIEINREHIIPVVENKSFPKLIRKIKIDENKCGLECLEIKEPCPLGIIKISPNISNEKKVYINIEVDSCPCCRLCETKFPTDAIRVEKIFSGRLRINREKCPTGCHDCVDVCPIPGVLQLSRGQVQVKESNCVYCGTCKIVCPEDALELKRTRIRHTDIHSGAWNKSLEKLTSTSALTKELQTKSKKKLLELVNNRFPLEEENNE